MKTKKIFNVCVSVLLSFTLLFMYPIVSTESVSVLKSFFGVEEAYADNPAQGGQQQNYSQMAAQNIPEYVKQYQEAEKRKKNQQLANDIQTYYSQNKTTIDEINGGKDMASWGPKEWDKFYKKMSADEEFMKQVEKTAKASIELLANTSVSIINGLTQSITGYYDGDGQYVKVISPEKLYDYSVNNIVPNLLSSSSKLIGQFVGGPTGGAVCGFLFSLGTSIAKFCKAWNAPPPEFTMNIDQNNAVYSALDRQTGVLMNAIDNNTKIMTENFKDLKIAIDDQNLDKALDDVKNYSDQLWSLGQSFKDRFKGYNSSITACIPEDIRQYYYSVMPTFYDGLIPQIQDDIAALNKELNNLNISKQEAQSINDADSIQAINTQIQCSNEQISQYQAQINDYKSKINFCISKLPETTNTQDNADTPGKKEILALISKDVNTNDYASYSPSTPSLSEVYSYIMQKRNMAMLLYNYSHDKSSEDLTSYSYSEEDQLKEQYFINDYDYIALYSILVHASQAGGSHTSDIPNQESVKNLSFKDIGELYDDLGINILCNKYKDLRNSIAGDFLKSSLDAYKDKETGLNKYFNGAKLNNAYDAFFTYKLKLATEKNSSDPNQLSEPDYLDALTSALSDLRMFHDHNMSALSESEFLWNAYCVCKNYQKSITAVPGVNNGKDGVHTVNDVNNILQQFSINNTPFDIEAQYNTCINEICSFEEVTDETANHDFNMPYDYFNQIFNTPFQTAATLTFNDLSEHNYSKFEDAWKDANKQISKGNSVILTLHKDVHANTFDNPDEPIVFTGQFDSDAAASNNAKLTFNMNGFNYYYSTPDAIHIEKPSRSGISNDIASENLQDLRSFAITCGGNLGEKGEIKKSSFIKELPSLTSTAIYNSDGGDVDNIPSVAVINANYDSSSNDCNFRRRAVHGPDVYSPSSTNSDTENREVTNRNVIQSLKFSMDGIDISDTPKSAVCIAGNLEDEFYFENCTFNDNPDCAVELCEFSKITFKNTTFENNKSQSLGNKDWNSNQGGAAVRLKNFNVFNKNGGLLKPFEAFYYWDLHDGVDEEDYDKTIWEREQIRRNATAVGWQLRANNTVVGAANSEPRVVFESCTFKNNIAVNGNGGAIWIEDPKYATAQFTQNYQRAFDKNWDTLEKHGLTKGEYWVPMGMVAATYNAISCTESYFESAYFEDYFQFKNCVFDGNKSDTGSGGAISFSQSSFTWFWPCITLDNCSFSNNTASLYGAVLFFETTTKTKNQQYVLRRENSGGWGTLNNNFHDSYNFTSDGKEYVSLQRTKVIFDGDNYSSVWTNNTASGDVANNAQLECDGRLDIFTTHATEDSFQAVKDSLNNWMRDDLLGGTKYGPSKDSKDKGRRNRWKYLTGDGEEDFHEDRPTALSQWYYSVLSDYEFSKTADDTPVYLPSKDGYNPSKTEAKDETADYTGDYYIEFADDKGWVVDIEKMSTDNKARAHVYHKKDSDIDNQIWTFKKNWDGTYCIINRNSGKYMDVEKDYCGNGHDVMQYQPLGTACQKWIIKNVEEEGAPEGSVRIVSAENEDYCICSENNDYYKEGNKVETYFIKDNHIDKFKLTKVWSPKESVFNGKDDFEGDFCIATGANPQQVIGFRKNSNGDEYLSQYRRLGSKSQIWSFTKNDNGTYLIQNADTGKYLNLNGASNYTINQHDYWGDTSQYLPYEQWYIEHLGDGKIKIYSSVNTRKCLVFSGVESGEITVQDDDAVTDDKNVFQLSTSCFKRVKYLHNQ